MIAECPLSQGWWLPVLIPRLRCVGGAWAEGSPGPCKRGFKYVRNSISLGTGRNARPGVTKNPTGRWIIRKVFHWANEGDLNKGTHDQARLDRSAGLLEHDTNVMEQINYVLGI